MFTHMRRHPPSVNLGSRGIIGNQSTMNPQNPRPIPTNLPSMFSTKYPANSPKASQITLAIGKFIVADMRPFSMVESAAFRDLMATADPRYKVPNRQHFSDILLPKMYNDAKARVKAVVSQASRCALTTDGWTSRVTQSFITITCHLLNKNWDLENYVLQTRIMDESHTGQNVAEVLWEAITEWGISDPNPALVTDNAANMSQLGRQS